MASSRSFARFRTTAARRSTASRAGRQSIRQIATDATNQDLARAKAWRSDVRAVGWLTIAPWLGRRWLRDGCAPAEGRGARVSIDLERRTPMAQCAHASGEHLFAI